MHATARTALLALALLAAGCGEPSQRRLNAGGSTFVFPLMSLWTHEYHRTHAIEVNYQSFGSGGAIQHMTARVLDFGCTDSPLDDEQLRAARQAGGEVLHIPLVLGAVVPAYNLEEARQPLRFSGPVLADIYLGKITRWNDPALRQLNPDTPLPERDIIVLRRSDGSGTTYVWADYLARVSPAWKEQVGVGTSVNWPTGVGQKGGAGVAGQVLRCPGSLGYIELSYALHNNIPFALVQNRAGRFVRAGLDSVRAAADNTLEAIPDDLRYSLTDAPGQDSYPISGTTWAILYEHQPAGKGRRLVDFLRWLTHEGQDFCEPMSYVRLPEGLVKRGDRLLERVKIGD